MADDARICLAPRGLVVFAVGLAILVAPFAAGAALLARTGSAEAIDVTPAAPGAILVRPVGGFWWIQQDCPPGEKPCHWYCDDPPPLISVIIDREVLHVTITRVALEPVRITRDGREWERLAVALGRLKHTDMFVERDDIRIAAGGRQGSGITHAELVRALEVAGDAGFVNAALFPVEWLDARRPALRATEELDLRYWP